MPSFTASSDVSPDLWTSRSEMERCFGRNSVAQWADLDGDADATSIQATVDAYVAMATDDLKTRLVGAPCGVIVTPSVMCRLQATRRAGVMLYTGKGVKDTSSEDGAHRLKWADEQVTKWVDGVLAGKIRVTGATPLTQFPIVEAIPNPFQLERHLRQEAMPGSAALGFPYQNQGTTIDTTAYFPYYTDFDPYYWWGYSLVP